MADKKPTHVVTHDSLYLAVGGKLQEVPNGTQVYLTAAQAKPLAEKGRVTTIKEHAALEIDSAKAAVKEAEGALKSLTGKK